ncbi:carboxylesterase/lipase family protein [Nocardia jejuensis]|uniref:carboxylesterase/lipase family protein n=1 Tax=Nocardia jejuensis TaxID=328049 RepID=UPI000A5D2BEC|nr:carboxylesterase family protein [Nocardia jejuensis]
MATHEGANRIVEAVTTAGRIAGLETGGTLSFKGIPYAAPPFGENRFAPPQPPQAWDGVREAFEFGPAAPQPDTFAFADHETPLYPWGTDCLSLNAFTPDLGAARLPVMVWLHPGGYVSGSASTARADGSLFAREGVVTVTVNYRLGVDGFLAVPGGTRNAGLRDIAAALQWVRNNIHRFGGDADAVTVFANSAGGGALSMIARTAAAEGLLRRAILQSVPLLVVTELDEADTLAKRVLAELDAETDPHSIPLPELLRRQRALDERFRDASIWNPYTYRYTPFMPAVDGTLAPDSTLRERIPSSIDLLIGSNRDESRSTLLRTGQFDSATAQDLDDAESAYLVPEASRSASRRLYGHLPLGEQLAETVTNQMFRGPAVELTRAHAAAGGNTFGYEFAWQSPAYDSRMGASHALELPFLFDNLADPIYGPQLGDSAPAELGHAIRQSWIRFAKTGDPGWPRYDAEQRSIMVFDESSRVESDPREHHRRAWDARAADPTAAATSWVSSA